MAKVGGGWDADPVEVHAVVDWLLAIPDASERYDRASAAHALHEAVSEELVARARALGQLHLGCTAALQGEIDAGRLALPHLALATTRGAGGPG